MLPILFHSPGREYSLLPCRRTAPFQMNWLVTDHVGCITTLQRSWAVNYRDGFGGIRKSLRAEPHLSKILSRMTQPLIKTMLYVWFPNGIGPNCGRTTPCTLQAIAGRETESSSWSCALMELLVAYGRRKAGAANSIWLSRRTAKFTPAS